jgi:hypothetical protein
MSRGGILNEDRGYTQCRGVVYSMSRGSILNEERWYTQCREGVYSMRIGGILRGVLPPSTVLKGLWQMKDTEDAHFLVLEG